MKNYFNDEEKALAKDFIVAANDAAKTMSSIIDSISKRSVMNEEKVLLSIRKIADSLSKNKNRSTFNSIAANYLLFEAAGSTLPSSDEESMKVVSVATTDASNSGFF